MINPLLYSFYFIKTLFVSLWTEVFGIRMFGGWSYLTFGGFLLAVLIVNFLCIEIYQFMHRESGGE